MKVKFDSFVLATAVVVVLAYFFPYVQTFGKNVPIDKIASVGVSLIFLFYGLKLSPDKIKNGLKNWKLHVLIQLSTFLVFPLIIILFKPFVHTENSTTIWLAFLFLAALPSTVSSSVVMVSIARGNVPSAIFNASISGLIGILVTPLWIGLFVQRSAVDFDLSVIYIKLIIEIIVPVVIGIGLQRYLGKYAIKYNRYLTLFDKSVILLIIYKSFSDSFEQNVFSEVPVMDFVFILIAVILLFYTVYFIVSYLSKLLKFNVEDQITAQFCGTKKSLVHGTIFSKILFANSTTIGIMLLPLMLFHAIQLFIVSTIAARLSRR